MNLARVARILHACLFVYQLALASVNQNGTISSRRSLGASMEFLAQAMLISSPKMPEGRLRVPIPGIATAAHHKEAHHEPKGKEGSLRHTNSERTGIIKTALEIGGPLMQVYLNTHTIPWMPQILNTREKHGLLKSCRVN